MEKAKFNGRKALVTEFIKFEESTFLPILPYM